TGRQVAPAERFSLVAEAGQRAHQRAIEQCTQHQRQADRYHLTQQQIPKTAVTPGIEPLRQLHHKPGSEALEGNEEDRLAARTPYRAVERTKEAQPPALGLLERRSGERLQTCVDHYRPDAFSPPQLGEKSRKPSRPAISPGLLGLAPVIRESLLGRLRQPPGGLADPLLQIDQQHHQQKTEERQNAGKLPEQGMTQAHLSGLDRLEDVALAPDGFQSTT